VDQDSLDPEKLAWVSDDWGVCSVNTALTSEISQACWPPAPPKDASLVMSVHGVFSWYSTACPGHSHVVARLEPSRLSKRPDRPCHGLVGDLDEAVHDFVDAFSRARLQPDLLRQSLELSL
jgi:hypothetical protein